MPQALRPVVLIVRGQRLPLSPWPEAMSEGMARFEARGKLGLLPGARVDAALEVYRAEAGILAPRECLLGDDGARAQLLRVEGDRVRTVSSEIAAQGEEGVALADHSLAGARVACASPDILTRIQAGTPAHWLAPTPVPDKQADPSPGTHAPVTLGEESASRATARVF